MNATTSTAWIRELVDRLATQIPAGYTLGGEPACEPTALAGLALCGLGETAAALESASWLAARQSRAGSIGVTADRPTPCWPTALAMMLWHELDRVAAAPQFANQMQRATEWTLHEHGLPAPRKTHFGHDSTIVGWSWAANTHSWIEPTAMFVAALKRIGHAQHVRTRDGVRLLVDRLLPTGGCNYGNTIVLGQPLIPHVQPTGLALWSLAGEDCADPRIERSLAYLERAASPQLASASLCYALLGLAAHGRRPALADEWLSQSYRRMMRQSASPYKLALIGLATRHQPFLAAFAP
jgi:hypothetical protein